LALAVVFFIDFLVILAKKNGNVNHTDITTVIFKADRLFSISIVLLSALIVEQYFSVHGEVNFQFEVAIIFTQIVFLGIIVLYSSLHHFHERDASDYRAKFIQGLEIDSQYVECCRQAQDSVKSPNKQYYARELQDKDSDFVAYWREVSVIVQDDGGKTKCHCQIYAIIALIFAFGISVGIRFRMLVRKIKNP
jgi:hypothetical protein